MHNKTPFGESLWKQWLLSELKNYTVKDNRRVYIKKAYLHLDDRFWLPERSDELKKILQEGLKIFSTANNRKEYWQFSPFLKMLIKTPRYRYQESEGVYDLETKERPICFASHIDSLIYSYYSFILSKKYESFIIENGFSEVVLAYRTDLGKCNIQFANEAFENIRKRGECTAIALDIRGYFDHIDHEILLKKWQLILGERLPEDQYRVYRSLTRYSYVRKSSLLRKYSGERKRGIRFESNLLKYIPGNDTNAKYNILRNNSLIIQNKHMTGDGRGLGIPQGSPMSALLSNIYLVDFDKMMHNRASAEGWTYMRYCDDILIICDTAKSNNLKNDVINIISNDYGLEIQPRKVDIIDFHVNSKKVFRSFKRLVPESVVQTNALNEKLFYKKLQYLGFEFDGQQALIRSSSLSRYFIKARRKIQKIVAQAYSSSSNSDRILVQQLLEKYSHFGKRNFITYAYNASQNEYQNKHGYKMIGLNSLGIKKQLRRHFHVIVKELKNKNNQRFQHKINKGKKPVLKNVNLQF